jgi:hypothetical protein
MKWPSRRLDLLAPRLQKRSQELMVNSHKAANDLRYVDAGSVKCSAGNLSGFRVCTEDEQPLGSVDGVLISPSSRQLRYFVVDMPGRFLHRRYLVPAETGATYLGESKTLQIGARRDEVELESYTPRSVPEFSDSDLLQAMFSGA